VSCISKREKYTERRNIQTVKNIGVITKGYSMYQDSRPLGRRKWGRRWFRVAFAWRFWPFIAQKLVLEHCVEHMWRRSLYPDRSLCPGRSLCPVKSLCPDRSFCPGRSLLSGQTSSYRQSECCPGRWFMSNKLSTVRAVSQSCFSDNFGCGGANPRMTGGRTGRRRPRQASIWTPGWMDTSL
jgi:hypothetical protein